MPWHIYLLEALDLGTPLLRRAGMTPSETCLLSQRLGRCGDLYTLAYEQKTIHYKNNKAKNIQLTKCKMRQGALRIIIDHNHNYYY